MIRGLALPLFVINLLWLGIVSVATYGQQTEATTVILEDDFNREEADPSAEQVGNGWGTNSQSRAKGVKQVDLVDGAIKITARRSSRSWSFRHA